MQWLILAILSIAAAWTASELEIFRLKDAIVKDLDDPSATFYSWLGVKPNAKITTIRGAFRKLSQKIHPDKTPGPGAQERYARLGLVNKVLQSKNRDTYDFYLKKGFPKLNAQGEYVFNRWKPSIWFIVPFILVSVTAIHFVSLKVAAHRKKQFVQRIIDEAFDAAAINGVITSRRTVSLSVGRRAVVEPDGSVLLDGDKVTTDLVPEPKVTDTVLLKWLK